jgi:hypothetical protein
MRPFTPEGDALKPDERDDKQARRVTLSRFRRNVLFYQRYWTKFFSVTHPDLTRLETFIRSEGTAFTLSSLTREIIRSRLRLGPQLTGAASVETKADTPSIRFWDPVTTWAIGDLAVFAMPGSTPQRPYIPRVGIVTRIEDGVVTALVDGHAQPRTFQRRNPSADAGGQAPTDYVKALFERREEQAQTDYVMWSYGDVIAEQVLAALQTSDRFLSIYPHWYPRTLSPMLSEAQTGRLARKLFAQTAEPVSFETLIPLVDPPLPEDPAGRFGLMRTLLAHPELFRNVGTRLISMWTLAGPPPGPWIAWHAAYDPETFEVLCVPPESIDRETAQRLWACDLFRAVVTGERSSGRGP